MQTAGISSHGSLGVYRRLLGYGFPYWRAFLLSVVSMIAYASLGPAFAKLIQPLIDGSFVNNDPAALRMAPFVLIGLSLLRGLAGFGSDYFSGWVSRRVITDLRRDMFAQFLNLPCAAYDRASSGQMMSKLLFNTEQVAESLTSGLTGIFKDGLTIIGLASLMVYENVLLSLCCWWWVPCWVSASQGSARAFARSAGASRNRWVASAMPLRRPSTRNASSRSLTARNTSPPNSTGKTN